MTTEDKGKLGKPLFRYFYNHLSNYTKTIIRLRLMNIHHYYMALSHKDWKLRNSQIWLAEMDIDRGLDFPI